MKIETSTAFYNLHKSSAGMGGCGGQLTRSLERILEEAHLNGELILTNRKLKDFPKTKTKFSLKDTTVADLSRNRFCELPEEIISFSFLETLLLYHNTIRSIRETVKQLTSLTYLDLRSNQLISLPRELCLLPLQVLLVSNNRLVALPDELGRMNRLTDLDVSYNQLATLPARIGELHSLRSLSLRSNQLMYLPRELTCLMLVSLDVSNNRIANLPLEVRRMTTLVEFNIENNPLICPPASLCVRGLTHVFKYLETQANKDEKGSRPGGSYDGFTTLRRAQRYNSNGNVLESSCVTRCQVDMNYSPCIGIDKSCSRDGLNKSQNELFFRKMLTTPVFNADPVDMSFTSAKPVLGVDSSNDLTSMENPKAKLPKSMCYPVDYANSYTNSSSVIEQNQHMTNTIGNTHDKTKKNLGNVQTYREYKEALKQQRNQESTGIYKAKELKALHGLGETMQEDHTSLAEIEMDLNRSAQRLPVPKWITDCLANDKNASNSNLSEEKGVCAAMLETTTDEEITLRSTELVSSLTPNQQTYELMEESTNGDYGGYIKPNSPIKPKPIYSVVGIDLLSNNKNFNITCGKSKFDSSELHRTVTWDHNIPPDKLSFTMRREFDRQREETELLTQLRNLIETRLKMVLPDDIPSALSDGVILCHLANYVHPCSVASIHVPSPGVPKLSMARCRKNVDNFLEACRKVGVDDNLICCASDVLEGKGAVQVAITVGELFRLHGGLLHNTTKTQTEQVLLPDHCLQ